MSRYDDATDFSIDYNKMTETERNNFARIGNKLLGVQYITHQKHEDRKDYYFIVKHFGIYKAYFSLLSYELELHETEKVIALTNQEGANRMRLRKIETIILLLLRLLYQKKLTDDLNDLLSVRLEDIHFELERIGTYAKRITKTDLSSTLRLFKRYNVVDFETPRFDDDDLRIILYPTLLFVARYDAIHDIYEKIETLVSDEEDEDEDTEESGADQLAPL